MSSKRRTLKRLVHEDGLGDSPSRLLVGLVRAMPQLEEDPEIKNAIFEQIVRCASGLAKN